MYIYVYIAWHRGLVYLFDVAYGVGKAALDRCVYPCIYMDRCVYVTGVYIPISICKYTYVYM